MTLINQSCTNLLECNPDIWRENLICTTDLRCECDFQYWQGELCDERVYYGGYLANKIFSGLLYSISLFFLVRILLKSWEKLRNSKGIVLVLFTLSNSLRFVRLVFFIEPHVLPYSAVIASVFDVWSINMLLCGFCHLLFVWVKLVHDQPDTLIIKGTTIALIVMLVAFTCTAMVTIGLAYIKGSLIWRAYVSFNVYFSLTVGFVCVCLLAVYGTILARRMQEFSGGDRARLTFLKRLRRWQWRNLGSGVFTGISFLVYHLVTLDAIGFLVCSWFMSIGLFTLFLSGARFLESVHRRNHESSSLFLPKAAALAQVVRDFSAKDVFRANGRNIPKPSSSVSSDSFSNLDSEKSSDAGEELL